MYTQYSQFWADYRSVSDYYETFSRNIGWMAAPDPRRAWGIYRQALTVEYGILVMGRTCVDEAGRTPDQFGNAITEAEHRALGVITHGDEAGMVLAGRGISGVSKATGGMIMHYYGGLTGEAKWRGGKSGYHFLYNDAWLLGGAHGHHDFNLASPRWELNIWDSRSSRLTATGRELVYLVSAGYRIAKVGSGGLEVMTCANDTTADGTSLNSLVGALRNITRREQILSLCTPVGLGGRS
jgi:hypothetical protein